MSKMKKPARGGAANTKSSPASQPMAGRGTRETIESIVIAVILAFLFRAFEAEAFVIPTGSMAPTLQGRHVDFPCPKCGYWYRGGASESKQHGDPPTATCPICRYTTYLPTEAGAYASPVTGDRILVSKVRLSGRQRAAALGCDRV